MCSSDLATGTVRAALSRGTVRLPALPAGDHSISVGMIPGIRLFANLPPAPGESASVWRARTVWRFDAPVTLTVRTDARGPRGINVIVYDPSPAARTDWSLTATVDRGNPRRHTHGVYTRSTPVRRVYTLPPSPRTDPASLVDGDRARIGLARPLLVPLGDDLEPGLHTVVLSPSQPVYARFFAVVPPGLQDNRALWPESLDE